MKTMKWLRVALLAVGLSAGNAFAQADDSHDDGWTFAPNIDRFSHKSLLDLRSLNEPIAGQSGFVRLSEDGERFVRGDGEPIRFWAVNTYVHREGMDALREHARFLAKRGVNMVRWHGQIEPKDGGDFHSIDEKALDELHQLVAAMKDEGIYVTISPYYAHAVKKEAFAHWPVPRDREASNPNALLFYDPVMQSAYKAWVRELLTRPNPYTGVPLKDEPAVAIFQIQNEDSLLFWTLNAVKGEDRTILEKQFGQWLTKRYGSLEKARQAWRGADTGGSPTPDDWESGRIALANLWNLFQDHKPDSGENRRYADQALFLAETMRNWNAEVERYLRDEVGLQIPINAGNWRTASTARLNDLERWSYAANQVSGLNRYVAGRHAGEHSGWAVREGQTFDNISVLKRPNEMPTNVRQTVGMPFIMPEVLWNPPTLYQGESPILTAAYQSLGGVDIVYWFSTGDVAWRPPSSANGYLDSLGKFVLNTPEMMGNFPAAALMYRMNYLAPGEPVVVEHRSPETMADAPPALIAEEGGFDPNRDTARTGRDEKGRLSPLAYLVGPVKVEYGEDAPADVADLSPFINPETKTVTSNTGQLHWNYGEGVVRIDAPKAQGVVGFLADAGGSFETTDATITSSNDYATILLVAMDNQPLAKSGQVLVQLGTTVRPRGWRQREVEVTEDGKTFTTLLIESHGHRPWKVRRLDGELVLRNPALTAATVLDPNGMPVGEIPLTRENDSIRLTLPADAKYVVLR